MGKYPIYAILALVFIGIIKLLQVSVFDAEKYAKSKKTSFSKPLDKVEKSAYPPEKAEKVEQTNAESEASKETPPSLLDQSDKDSTKTSEQNIETDNSFESPSTSGEEPKTSRNLSDLKNTYLAPKIARLPAGQLREDVVVRYYRHNQDDDKVYMLKDLGYYIHEKEATETAGLGSNVIYYGSDVAIEDILIVAYTLVNNGIPIKAIQPTQYSWKSTSIEIGTDTLMLDKEILSTADIQNFKK